MRESWNRAAAPLFLSLSFFGVHHNHANIILFRHRLLLLLPTATTSAATSFSFLFSHSRIIRRRIVPPSSSYSAMSSSNNNKNHELSSNDEDGVLQVKFLSNNAIMPTRGSPHAAGFDLSASEATIVPAGGRVVVKTDLCIACPVGTYARIAPRR